MPGKPSGSAKKKPARACIYIFELAERQQFEGNGTAAPVCVATGGRDSEGAPVEKAFRWSKEMGEAVVALLDAEAAKDIAFFDVFVNAVKLTLW